MLGLGVVALSAAAASSEGADAAGGDDAAYEPTDEEVDAAQAQLQQMFNTVKAVIGTVLAVILGFYGWTFWTSLKCYFAKEALKKTQTATAVAAIATSAKQATAAAATSGGAKADESSSSSSSNSSSSSDGSVSTSGDVGGNDEQLADSSIPPIDRQLRKIGPYRLKGEVVKGFGRGSSELGWPTANLDPAAFKGKIDDSEEGVYIAWAQVVQPGTAENNNAPQPPPPVFKSLVSVGWNPAYDNQEKTVEAYVCSEFEKNFYGAELRLLIVGYLRPQVRACLVLFSSFV